MVRKIIFTPHGLTKEITIRILPNSKRPDCCPDKNGCKPLIQDLVLTKENINNGYSGSCYGYCGLQTFKYKNALHENDISHCLITPLKGCARFFINYHDLGNDLISIKRLTNLLYPAKCDECKDDSYWTTLMHFSREPNENRWLCVNCAVRLGVIKYHPENIGTGRSVYY